MHKQRIAFTDSKIVSGASFFPIYSSSHGRELGQIVGTFRFSLDFKLLNAEDNVINRINRSTQKLNESTNSHIYLTYLKFIPLSLLIFPLFLYLYLIYHLFDFYIYNSSIRIVFTTLRQQSRHAHFYVAR